MASDQHSKPDHTPTKSEFVPSIVPRPFESEDIVEDMNDLAYEGLQTQDRTASNEASSKGRGWSYVKYHEDQA